MKQYCRYCAYCVYGDVVWCDELDKEMEESTAKAINHCKHFVFCEMDVFNPESGKYKPRKEKPKNTQPTLFD
jgi:hypothetical protein